MIATPRYALVQLLLISVICAPFLYSVLAHMFKPLSVSKMAAQASSSAKARLEMVQQHLHTASPIASSSSLAVVKSGSKFTKDYRVYYKDLKTGKLGSFFHDVPLGLNVQHKTVNMVVEIPRWSNAKMEITKELALNPITQDIKKGKLRFINNIYPFHGYIHNYGAIPQTWEDSTQVNKAVDNLKGDNDPLDVCDLGSPLSQLGEIITVKVLGSLALIDDGELDWKVIAINEKDPLSEKLNDIQDVEQHLPGVLESTRNWFRDYKVPTGKPSNQFAFNGQYKNASETIAIIEETHGSWKRLLNGEVQGKKLPVTINSSQCDSANFKQEVAEAELEIKAEEPDSALPENLNDISYLK